MLAIRKWKAAPLWAPAVLFSGLVAGCTGQEPSDGSTDLEADVPIEEEHGVLLDSAAVAIAGIEVGRPDTVRSTGFLVTGRITFDQNRVSHLGPRTEGYAAEILADLGAEVEPGDLLAVLESPAVGAARADLTESRTVLEIARENYDRIVRLEAQGITSRRDVLEAQAELRRAEAALLRAEQELAALGATEGEGAEFFVRAPFAGVVVERHAVRGEVLGPSDRMFTVAELDQLWIELDIYERDLQRVEVGQRVAVTTPAFPDASFEGEVAYLAGILDPERRTVHARVNVANPARTLRPGMFATAEIEVRGGATVIAVPRDAVQLVEDAQAVFVPGHEPWEFLVREVTMGRELAGNRVEILSGLAADELLVIRGAFALKSELAEGEFGGHGH